MGDLGTPPQRYVANQGSPGGRVVSLPPGTSHGCGWGGSTAAPAQAYPICLPNASLLQLTRLVPRASRHKEACAGQDVSTKGICVSESAQFGQFLTRHNEAFSDPWWPTQRRARRRQPCNDDRVRDDRLQRRDNRQALETVCRRKATTIASSWPDSTVDLGCIGPTRMSATEPRLFTCEVF